MVNTILRHAVQDGADPLMVLI